MVESQESPQRETAKIVCIKDLQSGTYVVQEGWKPNYVDVKGRHLSRVNLMGLVVSKPSPYEFSLDDGTGTISVTDFNQTSQVAALEVGEPVLLIGRPRLNNTTIFVACEIVNTKQLKEESAWMSYRKQQLKHLPQEKKSFPSQKQDTSSAVTLEKPIVVEDVLEEESTLELVVSAQGETTAEDIISFIKKKDTGEGCLVEDIISYFGDDIDNQVLTLITMGEIYEIKPGRVKVLE